MAVYCANCDAELERNEQGDLVCTTPGCILEAEVFAGPDESDEYEPDYDD
jgi:transcription initiation factor TFIIIB Brf1 subunit/transcription initiation factor TFIIB